jgi:glutaredoxin
LGLSVDSVPCLKAWADSLGGVDYPLLSDFYPHGKISKSYGVLRPEGTSERSIFVIDKRMTIRYIDIHNIDEQPDNEELFQVLETLQTGSRSVYKPVEQKPEPLPKADVILYCTSWCPECRMARRYLQEKGIQYIEVDITRNPAAARQVREWTGGFETTPTFQVYGQVVVRFQPDQLNKLLQKQV